MRNPIYTIVLFLFVMPIITGCGENTERLKSIDCSNSNSEYEKGIRAGEIIATASDGQRDCKYGYDNWTVRECPQLGLSVPEFSDCYCKGFYEGYDKTKK